MPDAPRGVETDAAEARALAADTRMVQAVRWRLVVFSGASTLLVLVVLALLLYASVARTLEASGLAQLDERMVSLRESVEHPRGGPGGPGGPGGGRYDTPVGYSFGGGSSGTFALLCDREGDSLTDRPAGGPDGLPDQASLDAAATSGRDVRLASVENVPLRVLTEQIDTPQGAVYAQVVQDRTAEQQTLDVIRTILLAGGLLVILVALGFGTVYARRALVPIQVSLANQRAALRRQREFAADASHELRTPLTVIRSSVEHLQRHRTDSVESVGDAVDDIGAEVDHLAALVDDLLLLARSDSGAVTIAAQPVDLGDVAADGAAALVKPAEERGIRISVDPEPAIVMGDPARLRQLVLILVDNAVRHSPQAGEIRVKVRSDGRLARLEVQDDGPGIPPADMPHVFERFWRAPGAPSGGTGLGLAIAASIVGLHGGRIGVSNRPGACFAVELPTAGIDSVAPGA